MKVTFTLGLLMVLGLSVKSQVGLNRYELSNSDSIFESCEEYSDFIICKLYDNMVIFNFTDNICTSAIIISNRESQFYLQLIELFLKYDNPGSKNTAWRTELHYIKSDTLICKIIKS